MDEEFLPVYELVLSSNQPLTSSTRAIPLSHGSAARVKCSLSDSGFDGQSLLLTRNQRNMTQNRLGHSIMYTVDNFDSNKGEEIFDCTAKRRDGKFHVRSMKFTRSRRARLANGDTECETNHCRNGGLCLMTADKAAYCVCPEHFMGKSCEESFDKISGLDDTRAIQRNRNIAICSSILLLLVLIVVAILYFRERKKTRQLKKIVRGLRQNQNLENENPKDQIYLEAGGDADLEIYDQADAGKPPIRRPTIINDYDNLSLKPDEEEEASGKEGDHKSAIT